MTLRSGRTRPAAERAFTRRPTRIGPQYRGLVIARQDGGGAAGDGELPRGRNVIMRIALGRAAEEPEDSLRGYHLARRRRASLKFPARARACRTDQEYRSGLSKTLTALAAALSPCHRAYRRDRAPSGRGRPPAAGGHQIRHRRRERALWRAPADTLLVYRCAFPTAATAYAARLYPAAHPGGAVEFCHKLLCIYKLSIRGTGG